MNDRINITLLGGVNEVGGNTFLLEDFGYDIKILIDFGVKIDRYFRYYPRKKAPSTINELIMNNLIPNDDLLPIDDLYTHSWSNIKIKNTSIKIKEQISLDQLYPSNLDGILISHAHKDHYFGISFINRSIPIYTGKVTKKIIKAFYKSEIHKLDNNFKGLKWRTFKTGDIINIKDLKIIPFHVDHSVPGAYGFIIYSSVGIIVYTGDFRMHGPLSNMTREFLEQIKTNNIFLRSNTADDKQKVLISKGVKVLLCEGTRIHKGIVESEESVENNLEKLFQNNPFNFILVKYDRTDWDRFRTFSQIAKNHNWKYIITEKDAYFYYLLNKYGLQNTMKDPNIIKDDHIYIVINGDVKYIWQEKIRQIIYKNQKGARFLKYSDLYDIDGNFFFYLTNINRKLIKNLNFKKTGLFISSSIDPYSEEFYDNTNTIYAKLQEFGIPCYRIHASGHVLIHDLINFVKSINPMHLIPVHTEYSEFIKLLFSKYDIDTIIGEKNKIISFNAD
ncbi:MAG: MBL fold metallo-hydrolase [Candidatus Lokiarchaeota archaeon]|nr:MBL fold metallo-hydrolase [Candidatus Lokiarchaeota archaeon]